jgi:hypothetical protein
LDGEYLTDIVNEHRVGSPEYFNTLRDQFDAAYNKLLKDVEIEAPGIISLVDEALEAAGTEFDAPLRARLRKSLLEGIPEEGVDMVTGRQLKKIMSDAADGVSKATLGGDAGKNMSAIAMYNAVRDSLSDLLGKRVGTDKVAALRQLDDAYAHRQVLELTASNVFGQSPGVLTPQGLSGAVSARSTPSMLANQTGTAAELSADMTTAMVSPKDAMWARAAAGTGIAPQNDLLRKSAAVVAGGILAPITIGGTTIRGSKFLRGQLGNQQAIAKAMREIIEPKIGTGTVLISNYEE